MVFLSGTGMDLLGQINFKYHLCLKNYTAWTW